MNADPNIPSQPSYRLEADLSTTGAIGELRASARWVAWAHHWNEDRGTWTKVPKNPATGGNASTANPGTWGTYEAARACQLARGFAGVGIVLTGEDDLIGGDLDKVIINGSMAAWARDVARLGETYVETSPSARGLRFLARGKLDAALKCDPAGVELYVKGRFLTLTGDHLSGTPNAILPAPKTLALLQARVAAFKKPKNNDGPKFKIDTGLGGGGGDDFFRAVKDAALARLDAWVPTIFPSATFQPGTASWRVTSRELGRDLEEDLSLAPSGIQDFGEERGLTAIDVVMRWGKAADAVAAALWLCNRLGVDPEAWGYRAQRTQEDGKAADDGAGSAGASDPSASDWREPDARFLRTILPEAPALPLEDMLSPSWSRWVCTAADSKGAPADYVLAALLSTAGALIGNTRWAAPWDGWSEPPIWWTAVIGNPSAGKSPGLDAVLSAVKRVERDARQTAEQEVAAWRAKAEVARLVESTWKEEVKAALKGGDVLPEKPREADPGPEPVMPRYALADATVEKLAVIVSRQPRGILKARDELSGWLGNMSRYSGGSDRPFWLEAYGGRGYSVERMGRDPVWIDHLSIGVVGGIQPDKLKSLLFKTDDDGLLARFMPIWPDPAPIKRPEAGIDDAFIETALRKLLTLRMVATETGEDRPWYIPFTEEARGYLNDFRKDARQWEADQEGLLLSFIGKLPGMAVRLSLILAYLDWAAGGPDPYDITAEHFARAAGFIETYALPMARRAYADGSTPKETRAGTKLAAIIIEARWQRFTTSDVLRLNRSGLDTKADLDPALDALETGDLIRALTPKTEGRGRGRPSRTFIVNPLLGSAR